MAPSFIPDGPQDLTPVWLTDALRSTGVLETGEVCSFETTALDDGKGFAGQIARVELEYSGCASPSAPSLIA